MRNISKTLLAVALGSFISGNALASDQGSGKITFKGVIIDAPCNIAPDSIDKEIELGQFTTAVMNVNKNPRRYRLISTENCQLDAADETATPVTKVDVTFSSTATDATDTSLMSNTYAGGAQNVGVRLLDNAESPITLGTAQTVDLSAGSATRRCTSKRRWKWSMVKQQRQAVESTANYVLLYK